MKVSLERIYTAITEENLILSKEQRYGAFSEDQNRHSVIFDLRDDIVTHYVRTRYVYYRTNIYIYIYIYIYI